MSLEHSVYKATARPLYDAEFHEETVEFLDIYKTCLRISERFFMDGLEETTKNIPKSHGFVPVIVPRLLQYSYTAQ